MPTAKCDYCGQIKDLSLLEHKESKSKKSDLLVCISYNPELQSCYSKEEVESWEKQEAAKKEQRKMALLRAAAASPSNSKSQGKGRGKGMETAASSLCSFNSFMTGNIESFGQDMYDKGYDDALNGRKKQKLA